MSSSDLYWGLIYIISCYEKGRCFKRIRTSNYKKSLVRSLDAISLSIKALGTNEIDLTELLSFCKDNSGVIIPKSADIEILNNSDYSRNKYTNDDNDLFCLAKEIVYACIKQINDKRFNRYNLWHLLMGLHNIPRAFISSKKIVVFGVSMDLISEEEAFCYAESYLLKLNGECKYSATDKRIQWNT